MFNPVRYSEISADFQLKLDSIACDGFRIAIIEVCQFMYPAQTLENGFLIKTLPIFLFMNLWLNNEAEAT